MHFTLKKFSPDFGGRFEAQMKNGERLIISRQYVPGLKTFCMVTTGSIFVCAAYINVVVLGGGDSQPKAAGVSGGRGTDRLSPVPPCI